MDEAHRLVQSAVGKGLKDPEAYCLLVECAKAKGLPWEDIQEWIAAAQKLDAKYFPLYTAVTQYLLPRWHGQPGDIEKFAARMADKIGGDDGLEAYARIACQANIFEGHTIRWGGFDRDRLIQSAEVLAKRYPQSRLLINFAAFTAFIAQDRALGQRLRTMLNGETLPQVWKSSAFPRRITIGAMGVMM